MTISPLRVLSRTVSLTAALSGRALSGVALATVVGCSTPAVVPDETPDIDIGGASPQTTPVPTGDATAPAEPRGAAERARPWPRA